MQDNSQTELASAANHARRFGGIARLYGEVGLKRICAAHVCVIGIGGVGSWAAESLARSAVGEITLIDMDIVAESNINRQLLATTASIGRDKGLVMRDRINDINPDCRVNVVDEFINRDNLNKRIHGDFNFVVDCIDDYRTKAALIHHCKMNKIKIVTIGGAGGQVDPTKVVQADLNRTQHDVLLAKTRKLLRQDYGFTRNLKRSFGIPCVYSNEQLVYPDGQGGLSPQRPTMNEIADSGATEFLTRDATEFLKERATEFSTEETSNALNCAGGIGSITHVTATFAFFASGFVLNHIVNDHPA